MGEQLDLRTREGEWGGQPAASCRTTAAGRSTSRTTAAGRSTSGMAAGRRR